MVSRYPRSATHKCDQACVCPDHPALPLLYAPLIGEHACQLEACRFGHGLENERNLWQLMHMTGPE